MMMVASCKSPTDYGSIDATTIAQIKILDRYVLQRGLGVKGITAWNFLNQRNLYRNLATTDHAKIFRDYIEASPRLHAFLK